MNLNNIHFKKPSELTSSELNECFTKFYPKRSNFLIKNWKWLYRVKLFGIEPLIMMEKKETIGFAGSISVNAIKDNEVKKAKWFVDFIIDKKKRNNGLGKILTKEWMNDDLLSLTFCNNVSLKIFKKFGWMESTQVYDSRLILNPLKLIPVFKNFNIDFFRKLSSSSLSAKNITPIKIKDNNDLLIDLFNNHNKKNSNNIKHIYRDDNWLNWRIFESPLINRYFLFKYQSSFLIIDHFFLNDTKRLSIIFSSFENDENKDFLINSLIVWSKQNKIDIIWHVFMKDNFFKNKFLKKTTKLNFAYYQKNLKETQDFFDLQGLDGDSDLLFYNDNNINI